MEVIFMATFGERLKLLREQKDLSQEALGKIFHLTQSIIAHYEAGRKQPSQQTLRKFADFFNVSVDYLLGRTDDPIPSRNEKMPPDIRKIARAGQKMTPEQRKQWLKVGEALFPEAFKEEGE
jgi:transcriptional regulator with XRE-family HTH domain